MTCQHAEDRKHLLFLLNELSHQLAEEHLKGHILVHVQHSLGASGIQLCLDFILAAWAETEAQPISQGWTVNEYHSLIAVQILLCDNPMSLHKSSPEPASCSTFQGIAMDASSPYLEHGKQSSKTAHTAGGALHVL